MLGQTAVLKVKDVTKIGAFLDWGLEKDLFLPFKEQTSPLEAGMDVPAMLYVDKSGRLCATMKVYNHLGIASGYAKDDQVSGLVYEIKPQMGALVAVDFKYHGMIPKNELFGQVKAGDIIAGRVLKVREDGKLDISIREKSYLQMDTDAAVVLKYIQKNGGTIPFTDKASPQLIEKNLGMSKNAFKRAVGRLLKEQKILIGETSISIK
jgi:predicted RNA-binding protein (virulence factor B family)